jgi:protein ImuA
MLALLARTSEVTWMLPGSVTSASGGLVEELKARLKQWETAGRGGEQPRVSSGFAALDRILPEQGFRRGALVEWLEEAPGSGAGTLALSAAYEACRQAGPLVVIDSSGQFYPPAAAWAGLDLSRLILVRTRQPQDEAWAWDQVLRAAGVAAVLGWVDRLGSRDLRRLQLAAETGGVLGLLVRPAAARSEPCWADVRWLVQALPAVSERRLRVELLRARGSLAGVVAEVELDHAASALRLAPSVALSASLRRSAGA